MGILSALSSFIPFVGPAISAFSAGKAAFGGGGDEESNLEGFKLPEFFEDPEFKKTQEFLSDFGINILKGDIPEFFKPLGETGSKQFEDVLALTKRDIQESALETAAITGRGRGGSVPSSVARAVGDASTKARFLDFQRAMEGKGFLFQQGRGITEGVRGAGLASQGQRNQFALGTAGLDLKQRGALDVQDVAEGTARGTGFANLISTVFGAGKEPGEGGIFGDIIDIFKGGKKKPSDILAVDPLKKLNLGKVDLFDPTSSRLSGSVL